jgi:hypothetical protein
MLFGLPALSLVIWLPILAGIVVIATGSDRNAQAARWLALAGALLGFLVALPLWSQFDVTAHGFQFQEFGHWIERFNINYHLGIDGISLPLILLIPSPGAGRAGWLERDPKPRGAIHGCVPDPVRADERRVQRARCRLVLRLLRGHADPDVHRDRGVGR